MKADAEYNHGNLTHCAEHFEQTNSKLRDFANEIRIQNIFWISFLIFFTATIAAGNANNDGILDGILIFAERFLAIFELLFAVLPILLLGTLVPYFFYHIRYKKDEPFFKSFYHSAKPYVPKSTIILRLILAFGSFSILMGCFIYWKEKIGQSDGYTWDTTFAEWDAAIFAGHQAWEVLHPLLGYEAVTKLLDFIYFLWTLLCATFWILAFISPKLSAQEKHHYLLASLLSWIVIGLFTASYFAAGGPVYYYEFTGDKQLYSGLLEYLRNFVAVNETGLTTSSLYVNDIQKYLWQAHLDEIPTPGGISAMPSMHNAQAVLFAILAYKLSRTFGHLMLAYAIAIFLGSIHLAWHYAVDGIIAALMVAPIWYMAGWLTGIYKSRFSSLAVED